MQILNKVLRLQLLLSFNNNNQTKEVKYSHPKKSLLRHPSILEKEEVSLHKAVSGKDENLVLNECQLY